MLDLRCDMRSMAASSSRVSLDRVVLLPFIEPILLFQASNVVINIWFSIKWNTSVVNELLGHIPVMRSGFSKTDDSLSSDSFVKRLSKVPLQRKKKKKFMKILT